MQQAQLSIVDRSLSSKCFWQPLPRELGVLTSSTRVHEVLLELAQRDRRIRDRDAVRREDMRERDIRECAVRREDMRARDIRDRDMRERDADARIAREGRCTQSQ